MERPGNYFKTFFLQLASTIMAPNVGTTAPTGVLFEEDPFTGTGTDPDPDPDPVLQTKSREPQVQRKRKPGIVWRNVILFLYLHVAAVYGLYLIFTSARLLTTLFGESKNNIFGFFFSLCRDGT